MGPVKNPAAVEKHPSIRIEGDREWIALLSIGAWFGGNCVDNMVGISRPRLTVVVHFEGFPRTLTRRASEGIEATFGAALGCASG
jgi:hypothetical protein